MKVIGKIYLLLLCFSVLGIQAQEIYFDFEELEFNQWVESESDHWHIDTVLPINGFGSLHHKFDTNDSFYDVLAHNHETLKLDSALTEWIFTVRYNYNPSAGNHWAVWLTSSLGVNQMHPKGNSTGYIIGVNYLGSDDNLKVWRQKDEEKTVVVSTSLNWQENIRPGQDVRFKVSRNINKEWAIFIDTSGVELNIASFVDSSYSSSEFFGMYYKYTSAHDQKLWFDDIFIKGFFYRDTVSPAISYLEVLDSNHLAIQFGESIDTSLDMLFVLNRRHKPTLIRWHSNAYVELGFQQVFGEDNLLEIYNLGDLKGNTSSIESMIFTAYEVKVHDIIITEVMSDPTPSEGLPECEFIELFNRTDEPINLKNWKFSSGNRAMVNLNEFDFLPSSYLLISENNCIENYADAINRMGISSMPTLSNSGDKLILKDNFSKTIHELSYSKDWFADDIKSDGGWSLEMIDLSIPCVTTNNWNESKSDYGGTPGYINSINGVIKEYPFAQLINVDDIKEDGMRLVFSESLDISSASNASNFMLQSTNVVIRKATIISTNSKEVLLEFSSPLESSKTYTLLIDRALIDCAGQEVITRPFVFGIPQKADSADIIINEILFESNSEVPEFIELYNQSSKTINLAAYKLASLDGFADTIKSQTEIVGGNFQFFPKTYLVITENRNLLFEKFSYLLKECIIEPKTWLSLSNEGGRIGLINSTEQLVDVAVFSREMHFALLNSTAGVSLERISPNRPGDHTKSWHSASKNDYFSTPGERNSQQLQLEYSSSSIFLSPKEISPDNDGVNDFLSIEYNFPTQGYVSTVSIFNKNGVLVSVLINNELCGTTGSFIWDGLDENGAKLPMGYYIIYFEAWNTNGDVINNKQVVLLLPEIK